MPLPFLNPWMLLAASGVAMPVLIHLFNRHRYRDVHWAAMHLLRRAVHVRARRIRLQDILLMLLRCLAVLLVALAAARPTTRLMGPVADADVGALVVIDGSYSMQHAAGTESRFDRARRKAKEILNSLPPGRPVTIAVMGDQLQVILRNTGHNPQAFQQALDALAPAQGGLNLETCLADLRPLVEEIKAPRREVYLLTDAQQRTWGSLSARGQQLLRDLGRLGHLAIVTDADAGGENVGVVDLALATGALQKGAIVRYIAKVHNYGRSPRGSTTVRLYADEQAVDSRFVGAIAPGESASVPLYVPLNQDGPVRLRAEIDADDLRIDDVFRTVAHVHGSIRVLCVDGAPSNQPFTGASDFAMAALLSSNEAADAAALEVTAIPWLSLANVRLSDYQVVVLANVPELPEERLAAMREFVELGGGLLVFAGENTKPALESDGQAPAAERLGLLPVSLASIESDLAQGQAGFTIDPVMPDHLITRSLGALAVDTVMDCRFRRFVKAQPLPESRVVLQLAGGEPLLVERQLGRGRVMFFASSPDQTWGNMPVNPAYPILLRQSVTHMLRRQYERPATVGSTPSLELAAAAAGVTFDVVMPDGQVRKAQARAVADRVVLEAGTALAAGFQEYRSSRDEERFPLAVNVQASEADVWSMGADALRQTLADAATATVVSGDELGSAIRQGRVGRELWGGCLIGALGLLGVESVVARRRTLRKHQSSARGRN